MANPARNVLICGAITVAIGGFCGLEALGVIAGAAPAPSGDERAVGACIAAVFVAGGGMAMLTTLPGPRARAAINLLALVVVICLAAIAGWIAIGPGDRSFSSPLAIFGPRVNAISGRIVFGLGALGCLAFAVAMVRGRVTQVETAGAEGS